MKKTIIYAITAVLGFVLFAGGIGVNNFAKMYWIGFPMILIGLVLSIFSIIYCVKSQKKIKSNQPAVPVEKRKIKAVKILGTRAGFETRVVGTYNYTIYSILILYTNGEKEVVECEGKSDKFKELIQYIEIGKKTTSSSEPLSVDEMIEYDEMND